MDKQDHTFPDQIYFVHIRKTGGSSLNHMFLSLGNAPSLPLYRLLARQYKIQSGDRIFVGWNKALINQGKYFYGFSHHPLHTLRLPPRTFTFTVLRDPVRRVISLYNMLMRIKTQNIPHEGMKEQAHWLGDTFDDFLDRAPLTEIANQLYMFSPVMHVDEALDRVLGLSYYFFTESFNAGVARLNEKLGIQLVPVHAKKTALVFETPAPGVERLREMLDDEYRFIEALRTQKASLLSA